MPTKLQHECPDSASRSKRAASTAGRTPGGLGNPEPARFGRHARGALRLLLGGLGVVLWCSGDANQPVYEQLVALALVLCALPRTSEGFGL
jgi:hypothetical protein